METTENRRSELEEKYGIHGKIGLFCPDCGWPLLFGKVDMTHYESRCSTCGHVLNSNNPNFHQEIIRGLKKRLSTSLPEGMKLAEGMIAREENPRSESWAAKYLKALQLQQKELTEYIALIEQEKKKSKAPSK